MGEDQEDEDIKRNEDKDSDEIITLGNDVKLPRYGINQWLEILYFHAFDERKN